MYLLIAVLIVFGVLAASWLYVDITNGTPLTTSALVAVAAIGAALLIAARGFELAWIAVAVDLVLVAGAAGVGWTHRGR